MAIETHQLRHTPHIDVGAWIAGLLDPWSVVTSQVPRGYETYVRIFHRVGNGTWADACAVTGATWHPLMQWQRIGTDGDTPEQGTLGAEDWMRLAAVLGNDTSITAGLWSGYGTIGPNASVSSVYASDGVVPPSTGHPDGAISDFGIDVRAAPQLELPGREYALFTGMLSTLTHPGWRQASGWPWFWSETVNLLWPEHRQWFVASEIDFDSTLVGCSEDAAQRILSSGLEAAIVPADGDLSSRGDTVNV